MATKVTAAEWGDGYNADNGTLPTNTDWMKNIPDDTPLKEMSIPGTHHSDVPVKDIEHSYQVLHTPEQLNGGIRFIEVQAQLVNDTIAVGGPSNMQGGSFAYQVVKNDEDCHSNQCKTTHLLSYYRFPLSPNIMRVNDDILIPHGQKLPYEYTLQDMLSSFRGFLQHHPSETILLKLDAGELGDAYNSKSYNDELLEAVNQNSDVVWAKDSDNPTLGDVRGKVVLINNRPDPTLDSIEFSIRDFNVQPDFHMNTNWDLYHRWELVKDKLIAAKDKKQTGIINYLTGYGGSFAYFVASGHSSPQNGAPLLMTGKTTPGWQNDDLDFPRVNCAWFIVTICSIAFEGTNELTKQYLLDNNPSYAGIIVADFPGPGLVQSVIDSNPHKKPAF
ncbi:hypothetical protein [Parashewanella curva]|uniref:hypothetical protein n=1 Tax=Parashewanella curva TaxID=2338552 RepID=UPI00105A8825|nr:hypothetical protein [Parashewanella curva]